VEGGAGLLPGSTGDGALWISGFTTAGPPIAGNVSVRRAPHAALTVSGTVANDAVFGLTVDGEPGAAALVVLSLDTDGPTLFGIGDVCVGFGGPHLLLPLGTIGGGGQAATAVVLHGVADAVRTAFVAQGCTLLGGDVGIGNAHTLDSAP
jgi:hypothetical protein